MTPDAASMNPRARPPLKAQDHPLIASLIVALPSPGDSWPEADRAAWLKAAEGILALVYPAAKDGQKAA